MKQTRYLSSSAFICGLILCFHNEHGFVRTTNGKFHTIDVPGAYQTGAGGLDDAGTVVGHYADNSCNSIGYIAIP